MEAKSRSTVWSDAALAHGAWLSHETGAGEIARRAWPAVPPAHQPATVFVVDRDRAVREATRGLFEENGYLAELFADLAAFLRGYRPAPRGCLLIDEAAIGTAGLAVIDRCGAGRGKLRYIVMSAHFTLPIAVQAMRSGAFDLAEKPLYRADILASVRRALDQPSDRAEDSERRSAAAARMTGLTARQREILDLVVAGQPSKNIAADLGISLRTVENHRAKIARRTGSKSLPALIRTAACANCSLALRVEQSPAVAEASTGR